VVWLWVTVLSSVIFLWRVKENGCFLGLNVEKMKFCTTKLNKQTKRTYLLFTCVMTALMMTATQFLKEQAKHAAKQFVEQKVGKNAEKLYKICI
jgi:hypothetical protein